MTAQCMTTPTSWPDHLWIACYGPAHYDDMLTFLDMQAQDSGTLIQQTDPISIKVCNSRSPVSKKTSLLSEAGEICIVCKAAKHPLYLCSKFRALPHRDMLTTLRESGLSMNCLESGCFAKDGKWTTRCRKRQNPHHTVYFIAPWSKASRIDYTSTTT